MFTVPTAEEVLYTVVLMMWVLFVAMILTKWTYDFMRSREVNHHVAVYYNRKFIHVLAGGVVAILVPYLFKSYTMIGVMVAALAIGNLLPHRRGKLLYWYQVKENMYEVNFIIMWGLLMLIGFLINDVWLAVVPIMFMAVGDGITGLVRNFLHRKRTKAFVGNIAMMGFCVPYGYVILGLPGALAGFLASLVERFEFGVVDDNVLVPITALVAILALRALMSG
ncbi:MAG: dolichol kinase [Thaumarchaeota archaeon]|nr:dolichol kinase [Candidatus Calditenuaceae archaeon]MDW8187553.1 dolichol kinase [Nitrososphaerota archaeon]